MCDSEKETASTSSGASVPPLLLEEEANGNGNGATLYKYRDFSNMPEEADGDDDSTGNGSNNGGGQRSGSLESSIRVQKFPVKLYAILAQKEFHDIITWMPHGRSWKVLKPNLFESMVMPLFFEYSNYHSFNRLVNAWSFRRISSGPDRGSYYHELFLRGKPHLQKYMRRLPKTHKKLPMKKEDEPDFYKMDKECSLPPLEEISLSSSSKMAAAAQQGAMRGGAGAHQPLAFSPVAMHQQQQQQQQQQRGMMGGSRGGGAMFSPEGVGSEAGFGGPVDDFSPLAAGTGGGSRNRSPTGMPGMRDPTNFGKSMEFKPVTSMEGSMGTGSMGSAGMSQGMMGAAGMGNGMMQGGMGGMGGSGGMNGMMGAGGMNHPNAGMMGMSGMGHNGMMGGHMGAGNMGGMGGMGAGASMSGMMNPQGMGGMGGQGMGAAGMMGGQGMGAMGGQGGSPSGTNSQQFYNLQRLRQMQQLQMFDRQMGGAGGQAVPVGAGGEDGFGAGRMGAFRPHC